MRNNIILRAKSNPGDAVLDYLFGTGTCAVPIGFGRCIEARFPPAKYQVVTQYASAFGLLI